MSRAIFEILRDSSLQFFMTYELTQRVSCMCAHSDGVAQYLCRIVDRISRRNKLLHEGWYLDGPSIHSFVDMRGGHGVWEAGEDTLRQRAGAVSRSHSVWAGRP